MLRHRNCGGYVEIEMKDIITISASLSTSAGKLVVSGFRISPGNKNVEIDNPTFICTECGKKDIKYEDMYVNCDACGRHLELDNAFTSKKAYHTLCDKHFATYGEGTKIKISEIVKKVQYEN